MNESEENLIPFSNEEYDLLENHFSSFDRNTVEKVFKNLIEPLPISFNTLKEEILVQSNYNRLNINPPLYDKEISRQDFFELGGVIDGKVIRVNYILFAKINNRYGGIISCNGGHLDLNLIRKGLADVLQDPWSIFDHRIWVMTEQDAFLAEMLL